MAWPLPRLACARTLLRPSAVAWRGQRGRHGLCTTHAAWRALKETESFPATPQDQGQQQSAARAAQIRRPWHRDGVDRPPVDARDSSRDNSCGVTRDTAKGRLLTTPNRLLKFVLPLPVGTDGATEPLSLSLHPQQPISYVQRLVQAELPLLAGPDGRERAPNVSFWAEGEPESGRTEDTDTTDGWVRWGSSTELGDFIREAARGREFAIRIEGAPEVRVAVPSFADRTHYQRLRLRRLSAQLARLSGTKAECDALAHRSARRLAKGGFGVLVGWWGTVCYVTFGTPYGWDLVEPVTYLVSLSAILCGYSWFLFVSRDVSYKAAMHVTVSRQQTAMYEARGFDVQRWAALVDDVRALRAEIRRVAFEYDADWDEAVDMGGEHVQRVLAKEAKRRDKAAEDDDEQEHEEEHEPEKTK